MELTRNFEPAQVEQSWREYWNKKNYFRSVPDERTPFTVVIPPPNVTGVLHMGHTLNETVQDILVRRARLEGFNACWVPGSDHASIATEAKVVQMLEKEKGIRKKDLSREQFLQYAFEWKEKYGGIIYNQIERLGCSVDWERVTFTMDPHYYQAVIRVFVDLYEKGLIYRGARMINWDPAARTALSDEEVEYREVQGTLYYVKYQVKDTSEFIMIATQRPETIMGDSGVAVNPNDERYKHLAGKKIIIPLVNREVPLVADEYVDPEFGTGALKITPAHDLNDYNLGLKHGLEIIDTLDDEGLLNEKAKIFVGMDRFEARKKVVEALKEQGLLVKEEVYTTRLGYSQRSQAVVEPRISTQWFLQMKELANSALEEVLSGRVKIHPGEKFLATYKYWLENVKDWCISRQLWWGQQIPAWYTKDGQVVVAATAREAAMSLLREKGNRQPGEHEISAITSELRQDEDVLDTWFSSWLWPMEVFKGITEPGNRDIEYYYPTSVLVTGQDIMFFWVARMIMAGKTYMNEKPFSHVYFTGMVRDKLGRKMSKQLGNSPDLLDLVDRFGADAVRFGIMISSPAGNDLLFDESSCDQGRNFNNKIWNALKLVKMWEGKLADISDPDTVFAADWFRARLEEVKLQVETCFREFRLSEALKLIYSLAWDDFCSWYLEWIKPGFEQPMCRERYQQTLEFFDEILQLLHPFMPFITEEVYHQLRERKPGDDLVISRVKPAREPQRDLLKAGDLLKEAIRSVRDARNKLQLKPRDNMALTIQAHDSTVYQRILSILSRQLNANPLKLDNKPVEGAFNVVVQKDSFYLQPEKSIDTGAQKEQLIKDLEYLKGFLVSVDRKLSNERFVSNAKPEVVEIERKKKQDAEEKIRVIEESLSRL